MSPRPRNPPGWPFASALPDRTLSAGIGFVGACWSSGFGADLGMAERSEVFHLKTLTARCLRLAKQCSTPSVSESLVALAAEYMERAATLAKPAFAQQQQQQEQSSEENSSRAPYCLPSLS